MAAQPPFTGSAEVGRSWKRKRGALDPVQVTHSEMKTFTNRLDDICKAEEHGYHRHFEIAGQLLFGGAVGAGFTEGVSAAVAVAGVVFAALLYFAGMKIREAHGDSIAAFRRDFQAVMDELEWTESVSDLPEGWIDLDEPAA